ncbi:hypothetical protein MWU78_16210 [Arenibacter sp. F26102]|uniref:hypothetical protein n=1 Tax=Arenibacter sp. F26102 TaxID=2926416 RepID=UPI001FF4FC44|nr:hypothetical protein [Arenibacter sp. F26102]MCK0147203.1 hypothetical protein [Arenibacter sp. F26102]
MNSKNILFKSSFYVLFSAALTLFSSCTDNKVVADLIITEPAGITRDLEYVEVKIPIEPLRLQNKALFLRNSQDGNLIKGQILNRPKALKDSNLVHCLFPISIGANETNEYDIVLENDEKTPTELISKGEGLNLSIENEYYKADLGSKESYNNTQLDPGQLTSLVFKKYNGITLERGNIKMHWAPSFQKKGMEYKTMGHIKEFDSIYIEKGPYMISVYRSGKVKGYEEIQVQGEYKFYAAKPYFRFSSEMTMVDSLTVIMLKNDEMTMDRFFTHAIFPLANGKVKSVPLYDKLPLIPHYSIKELMKKPIDTDTKWFGFYNDSTKYGLGSLRVRFDYKNLSGGLSPMIDAQTKITYAHNEGRYWDRRFVDDAELHTPKGSRYFEENVYAIFGVDNEAPSKEMEKLYEQLSNPVRVKCNPIIK